MIAAAQQFIAANEIPRERYEYQMLYGVRSELQRELVRSEPTCVLISFGERVVPVFRAAPGGTHGQPSLLPAAASSGVSGASQAASGDPLSTAEASLSPFNIIQPAQPHTLRLITCR